MWRIKKSRVHMFFCCVLTSFAYTRIAFFPAGRKYLTCPIAEIEAKLQAAAAATFQDITTVLVNSTL
jgi:hypothetical protein